MGEVFEGFDETLRRRVALKTIRPDRRLDETSRKRFLREAQMLSQLDHPAICRIYDYVEGEAVDLLVLELIEGRTLRDAVGDSALGFSDRLRIAESIAEALAAAHRLGIVHRDLKPDNVMLTANGGVKVLDFGLARPIDAGSGMETHDPEEADDLPADSVPEIEQQTLRLPPRKQRSGSLLADSGTRVGERLGTPSYMSPEQARGETLTSASDMYSFGLVMQCLFTRQHPYLDSLPVALVLESAARGQSLPVTGVDGDVTALINALKVLPPSDRPTALDAVHALRRIADRPRRRFRRIAAAALLVLAFAAAAKYVADVRRERSVAVSARADAERRRGQAEELIAFMVGDLRAKLEPVGRLDVLDDVGVQALRYFNSLRPEEITPAELRRNAKTLSQLGEVRMAQGNLAAADEVLRASLTLASAAATRDPADAANQLELGASHFWMGSLKRQQGDLDAALDHYRQYLRISEALSAGEPKNADYRLEVSYGHSNVGTILEQRGELEEALRHYTGAVAIKEERLAGDPKRADWNADLATTVNKVGVVLLTLGRYDEAAQALAREHHLLQSALAAKPKDTRWTQRLAVNFNFQGRLAEERGDEATAFRHFTHERDLIARLVEHDPANSGWQRQLAVADSNLGRLLHFRGDLAGSERTYRQALNRLRPLLEKDPKRVLWIRDVATIHDGLALLALDRGRVGEARRESDAARTTLAAAPQEEADTRRLARQVSITRGTVAAREGLRDEAAREWQSVIDALWAAHRTNRNVRELDLLARALLHSGRTSDGAAIVGRLEANGYRRRPLMILWEASKPAEPANRA
jgi:serine/threonine-protein kinase